MAKSRAFTCLVNTTTLSHAIKRSASVLACSDRCFKTLISLTVTESLPQTPVHTREVAPVTMAGDQASSKRALEADGTAEGNSSKRPWYVKIHFQIINKSKLTVTQLRLRRSSYHPCGSDRKALYLTQSRHLHRIQVLRCCMLNRLARGSRKSHPAAGSQSLPLSIVRGLDIHRRLDYRKVSRTSSRHPGQAPICLETSWTTSDCAISQCRT